jgi:hypothetical protein
MPRWTRARTPDSAARALAFLRASSSLSGVDGEQFAAFVHLVRDDTRGRSLELLADPSPIVRAYAGECLVREHPEEIERVLPLLRDPAEIVVNDDLGGGRQLRPVGSYVLGALRLVRAQSPAHGAAFERVIAMGLAKRPPVDRRE